MSTGRSVFGVKYFTRKSKGVKFYIDSAAAALVDFLQEFWKKTDKSWANVKPPSQAHGDVCWPSLHARVSRSATWFRCNPVDILTGVLDVTGLAVYAILCVDLETWLPAAFVRDILIDSWWTRKAGKRKRDCCIPRKLIQLQRTETGHVPAGQNLCSGPSKTGRFREVGTASSISTRCAGWSWSWFVPVNATEVKISKLILPSGFG